MSRIHDWFADRLWFSYEGVVGPLRSDDGSLDNWTSRGIYLFGRNWTLWRRK